MIQNTFILCPAPMSKQRALALLVHQVDPTTTVAQDILKNAVREDIIRSVVTPTKEIELNVDFSRFPQINITRLPIADKEMVQFTIDECLALHTIQAPEGMSVINVLDAIIRLTYPLYAFQSAYLQNLIVHGYHYSEAPRVCIDCFYHLDEPVELNIDLTLFPEICLVNSPLRPEAVETALIAYQAETREKPDPMNRMQLSDIIYHYKT